MFARLKAIPYLPLLIGLTLLRLLAAARAGLVPDETYYWLWAQHLSFGYYDHPPMVAWWIAAFAFASKAALCVRLPFILGFLALCWLVYDTAKALFDQTIARRALLWLNACLLLSVGTVVATPDPPSVLMWAGGLWALARLVTSGDGRWWLVFGLFAGLGVEAKYTNLVLGLGVLVWLIMDRDARRWLISPWLWLGGVIAVVTMAPNLIWNAQHGWITVAKQFGRIEASHLSARYLLEFLLTQPLLLNPFIAAFAGLAILRWFKVKTAATTLLIALPLPLILYLLVHVFHDRIQGNWPAPVFPGLVLLAASAGDAWGWARKAAAPFGIGVSVLALGFLALGDLAPPLGAVGQTQGWDGLSQRIEAVRKTTGADWIASTDYDLQGELAYHLGPQDVTATAERARYAWDGRDPAGKALIVVAAGHAPKLDHCFSNLQDLGAVTRGPTSSRKAPSHKTDVRLYTGLPRAPGCDTD
ncbi:MAG: ArnT family glycosyltransferase [Asticcacaulis sp.]|uniref:ArnT family glycosyltransferase n=1 Tax=Asticcacaulis sp. TaxID=1872648 RepID=UPI003F7B9301